MILIILCFLNNNNKILEKVMLTFLIIIKIIVKIIIKIIMISKRMVKIFHQINLYNKLFMLNLKLEMKNWNDKKTWLNHWIFKIV